jgi:3-oxoisoapionate decarboxylase
MKSFKIGIDGSCLKPLGLSPFEILDWAIMNEAEGVRFSNADLGPGQAPDRAFLDEIADYAAENRLYLEWDGGEHLPFDPATGKPRDTRAANRTAAGLAHGLGLSVIRSRSRASARRDRRVVPTEELLRMTAAGLADQREMFRELGVILALETGFEFTTFELLRLFEMCGAKPGDFLGVSLDTMNLFAALEDPVAATRRILPWVVMTRIKDAALRIAEEGFVAHSAEAGEGVVDLAAVFDRLSEIDRKIHLTIEDSPGDLAIPVFDQAFLARFPDLAAAEFAALVRLSLKSRRIPEAGRIAGLDRDRGPDPCERRLKRDLHAVRRIVGKGSKPA